MDKRIKDMTAGRPAPLIFAFALPLMAGNVCQQLYTVADTMVVGRFLGVDALAALGAADWLNWMMLGTIQGFTQGFAVPMAQEFGAGRPDRLRQAVGGAAALSLVLAVLLTAAGQALIGPVLRLLNTPAEAIGGSALYLRVMFAGVPVVTAYNLLAGVLRSLGDGKTPLHAMLVSSGLNIALDLLFVIVFRWGIAGAAIATVLSQAASGLYCLRQVRRLEILRLGRADLRPGRPLTGRLLALGSPMAAQNAVIAVGGMILTAIVNRFGMVFLAGYTAANKLFGVLEMAAISYGYAMITYTGQNLGAGNVPRIRQGVRAALVIAAATSLAIGGTMLIFGGTFLSGFLSGAPEDAARALAVGRQYLSVMSVCLPALYLLHVVRSALQGMGNAVMPMVSGVIEFFMRTGVALALTRVIGGAGVFYAEVSAWIGADVILLAAYFRTLKRLDPP